MATTVTVTGDFFAGPGIPATGMAYWQLSSPLYDSAGLLIGTTEVIAAPINGGQMSVTLWANDDDYVQPAGTYWTVTVWLNEGNPGSVITTPTAAFTAKYVIKASFSPTIDLTRLQQAIPDQTYVAPALATNVDGGGAREVFLTSGPFAQLLDGGVSPTMYLPTEILDGSTA